MRVAQLDRRGELTHFTSVRAEILLTEPMALALCTWTAILLGILYMFFSAFSTVYRPYGLCVDAPPLARTVLVARTHTSFSNRLLTLAPRSPAARPRSSASLTSRSASASSSARCATPSGQGASPFLDLVSLPRPRPPLALVHLLLAAPDSSLHPRAQLLPPQDGAARPPSAARGAPAQGPVRRRPVPARPLLVRLHDVHERALDRLARASLSSRPSRPRARRRR